MINRLLTASLFLFGASLPFLMYAAHLKGWPLATGVFGLIYCGAVIMLLISVLVVNENEGKDNE